MSLYVLYRMVLHGIVWYWTVLYHILSRLALPYQRILSLCPALPNVILAQLHPALRISTNPLRGFSVPYFLISSCKLNFLYLAKRYYPVWLFSSQNYIYPWSSLHACCIRQLQWTMYIGRNASLWLVGNLPCLGAKFASVVFKLLFASLRHALDSLWPATLSKTWLSLVPVHYPSPESALHNPSRIWTWDFLGCCLSMNIPFPSLEVPCLVLSFKFHNLCHKECVCLDLTWPAYLY